MSGLEPIRLSPPPLPPEVPDTGPPPLSFEHRVRVSAFEPERLWKLHGDTLWMCTEGQPDIPIPLTGITTLRLSYDPNRMQSNRYRCHLHNVGGKVATIQNDSYKGIASFEDRSPSYIALIHLLIPRIASLNPRCVFRTGTSHLSWWGQAAFLSIVFGILLIVLILLYSAIGPLAIIKLVLIALFIPVAIRWFIKNKPKAFNPSVIPEELMPKG